jgi:hypothetical protein
MTEDSQRHYLLLLPAPEEEWARLPDSEHQRFRRSEPLLSVVPPTGFEPALPP